jgi:hypothetical protein
MLPSLIAIINKRSQGFGPYTRGLPPPTMDPLTALGLAANIIQFVDFAAKLISAGSHIHKTGTSQSEIDLGSVRT